ncbi:MAG: hypothetical protein RMJ17_03745 [Candidatus Aenigmarchaeota archaeon]|nr:hypothetical protein [Candidatus Aenigmarchaeota archaeon]MDW8149676.1 hypothetical protein [Candidatus Aenigmarchaeota archaeon]
MKVPYLHNITRTAFQFLIGALMFFFYNEKIDLIKLTISLASICFLYIFIYVMNDIIDYRKDVSNKVTVKRKKIANSLLHQKNLEIEKIVSISYFSLFLGLLLSFFSSTIFPFLMLGLLFTNFIHSNAIINIRNISPISIFNMLVMQLIKFSSGWFSQTSSFENFPTYLFVLFSSVYVIFYKAIKSDLKWRVFLIKEKISLISLSIISIFSLILSLFLYDIILPLLIVLVFSVIFFTVFVKLKKFEEKLKIGVALSLLLLFMFFSSSFIFKINPFLLRVNN